MKTQNELWGDEKNKQRIILPKKKYVWKQTDFSKTFGASPLIFNLKMHLY